MLVGQSKSDDARVVARRCAPLWSVLDEQLPADFIDNEDIVPSIDTHSETLRVADRKIDLFFQSDTNTSSLSQKLFVPQMPVDVLEELAVPLTIRKTGSVIL